ncbi:MAG: signal peptide peptidase SppA [Deltaproteobacteria bacterium]|nr:signal peptide peptidase SppA [Deltaproteobacteria bacterium]
MGKFKKFLMAMGAVFTALIVISAITAIFSNDEGGGFGDKVAVLEIEGVITDSYAINKKLREYARRDDVKAVVVRVNSPGGAVGASQEIYTEVKRLKEKKKVVISMGNVAASGGYYIAAPADMIVANPGTITGSIGVIANFVNMEKLFGTIGLRTETIKSGEFKDTGSPSRPMTKEERALLQSVINDAHSQFVDAVSEGRKIKKEEAALLANGRVFTGAEAKRLGLVDKLGNLSDAITEAGKLAGISGEPRVLYPERKKGLFKELMEEGARTLVNEASSSFSLMYMMPGIVKH